MEDVPIRCAALVVASGSQTPLTAALVDIIVLIVLILIHAFFSASEIAVITLNDNRIRNEAEEGDRQASRLLRLISEPSRFLATTQIGGILAGFMAAAYAAVRLTDRIFMTLSPEQEWLRPLIIFALTLLLAFVMFVFGEQVPRRLAQHRPERFARLSAGPIIFSGMVLRPFVWLSTGLTHLVLRLFRIDPTQVSRHVTEEEIRMMVDVGRESGAIHAEEKEMIENIFEFNDKDVSEIMTHRTNVVALDVESDFSEVLEIAVHEKYTRIPVYEENLDNVIGVLHIKDILYHAAEGLKQPFSLRHMIRTPYFVPESKQIDGLFREMQRDRIQMAIVIDEYGGTAGIVTIEDLLEEIVGNIQDEYDEEEQEIVARGNHTFVVVGTAPLHEVGEAVGMDFPDDDYDTIAGFVISLLGRIPEENELPEVQYDRLLINVLEMDERRVSRVQLRLLPDDEDEGAEDDE
ncbi:MAG: hemolysin family protein [Eubacteriales bacterium]|nr:hemolysin family protein [Eubacteriales bacterium]